MPGKKIIQIQNKHRLENWLVCPRCDGETVVTTVTGHETLIECQYCGENDRL